MKSEARSPILQWGPYLWADGTTPRKPDGLVSKREDLATDGVTSHFVGPREGREAAFGFLHERRAGEWVVCARVMGGGVYPRRSIH
jgi:hypothetical protein